ncbi:MAG: hypothetical protein QM737_03915 [Ferruginibacter sp.]
MKKILLFIPLLLISVFIFSQAPQGLNYQAVAYNGSGVPVTNQLLGVRLSVLDGSATGTLVYQETQGPTTDNTGLFSIVIGNGTVVSGAFNTINWGNGSKWLKTEIDITGGTSYVVMGTTQFMSVPYALYANTSGVGSASFTMPDGYRNATTVIIPDSINYTVPAGKNLYITSAEIPFVIDGDTLFTNLYGGGVNARTFIGASENSVVWFLLGPITAFLVDKTVEWKTVDVLSTAFTVPAGKQFVVVNVCSNGNGALGGPPPFNFSGGPAGNCSVTINSIAATTFSNMIFEPGTVISSTGCTPTSYLKYFILNGYLMDK